MTVRNQRSHAEFVGQVERLAEAISSAKATVVAARCDFSKQVQRPRLAHAVAPLARQRQRLCADCSGLVELAGEHERLAKPDNVLRMPDAVAKRAFMARDGLP